MLSEKESVSGVIYHYLYLESVQNFLCTKNSGLSNSTEISLCLSTIILKKNQATKAPPLPHTNHN